MLLKNYEIYTTNKWYSHVPNVVTKRDDGKVTIYWGKKDKKMSYNRSDVQVFDMEKSTWYIVDFAIPVGNVKEKEEEKIDKYLDLAAEVRKQFEVKAVILLIVLGALGTVPAQLPGSLENLKIEDVIGTA